VIVGNERTTARQHRTASADAPQAECPCVVHLKFARDWRLGLAPSPLRGRRGRISSR
jgi:hypothetical protein